MALRQRCCLMSTQKNKSAIINPKKSFFIYHACVPNPTHKCTTFKISQDFIGNYKNVQTFDNYSAPPCSLHHLETVAEVYTEH